jgi:hypothetical protein
LFAVAMQAAPPLTTIEDIIYKADGSRFNGVAFIEWKSFQAADTSSIATHSVTATIRSGAIRVQLVPTTDASSGAYYSVHYNSDGRIQFSETWAVPPSTSVLKLKDVRALIGSTGGEVLPPAATTEVRESDVVGLLDDLAARPMMGPGYAPWRAVYISETGALEAVSGSLSDCVRVDGTAGPCGGAAPVFVDAETPAGLTDGSNTIFSLASAPSPASSLHLFRNGALQKPSLDYTLTGATITFALAAVPQAGDVLFSSYRLAGVGAPVPAFVDGETPAGSINGSNTVFTLASAPSPASGLQLYRNGLLLKLGSDYTLTGNAITFAAASVPQVDDVLLSSYRLAGN